MAINFEAANMAGYNNPKIEVFEAIYPAEGSALIDFPRKSVILDCIKRGSVPVLMASNADHTEIYILLLGSIAVSSGKYLLSFSNCTKPSVADPPINISIYYDFEDTATPSITFDPLTIQA